MFAEKAFELIKELERSSDNLPAYNDEGVRQVLEEIRSLFEENQKDVNKVSSSEASSRDESFIPAIKIRHAALQRNKRCLLAYLYNRLEKVKDMRWQLGSILPTEVKNNLSENEHIWFRDYSKLLATYMSSIGSSGLNLTQDMKPPKSLYVEVKCLVDFGKFELDSGEVVLLKKNSIHLLPRSQVSLLISHGVLEHIV